MTQPVQVQESASAFEEPEPLRSQRVFSVEVTRV